jgi:glycosyltransferase involved in cell wall biosynthesis
MVKNKTILIVNDSLQKGGKERRMLELIKGLIQNDYKVILVIITNFIEYDYVYDLPIEFIVIERKYKFEYATFNKLRQIIKKFRPSIIHSWGYVSSIYLGPLAKIYRIKFVNGIIMDAVENLTLRNKYYLMSKISFPFSDKILSNSNAGIKCYRPPLNKTQCIYNGLDLNRFENLKPKQDVISELFGSELSGDYNIVGMVAAFEDRKDYFTLVDAAIKVCNSGKNTYFLLIGGGTNFDEVKSKTPSSLLDRIILTGKRNDVESIINIFDIGILLTNSAVHGEGVSNSIIEYMALAKPVIATRGGGTDEVVNDGVNGFRIDAFDPDQLTDKIKTLLSDKALSAQLGENGRRLVVENFSLEKMTASFIKLYTDLNKMYEK